MRATLAIVTLALVCGGLAYYAQSEHTRGEELAVALRKATEAQKQSDVAASSCKHSALSNIGRAFSAAMAPREGAAARPTDAGAPDGGSHFDDLPPERQAALFDSLDSVKSDSKKALDELKAKLHLNPDQDKLISAQIERMNHELPTVADKLLLVLSKDKDPPPRVLIDAVVDALNVVREADDAIHAELDAAQNEAWAKERFDLTSQIDPLPLVTRAIAFAGSSSNFSFNFEPDKPEPHAPPSH